VTSLAYIAGAYNGYLHAWSASGSSGTPNASAASACEQFPGAVQYPSADENGTLPGPGESARCTVESVRARHLGWTTDLWQSEDGAEGPATGLNVSMDGSGFEETLFTQRAVSLILNHKAEADRAGVPHAPLFLYYAMHLLHSPLCAPPRLLQQFAFIDNLDRRYAAAMASLMDESVDKVVRALNQAHLWDNSLFIWTSDNGAAIERVTGAKSAYPLRGGYYTNWEGGIRAPGVVNGGALPPTARGRSLAGLMHLCDWLATFCHLAGCNTSDARAAAAGLPPIDSLNMWPLLSGTNMTSPRTEVWLTPLSGDRANATNPRSADAAIILGRHKLIVGNISQASWTGRLHPNNSVDWDTWSTVEQCTSPGKLGCLFDGFRDEREEHDLALEQPDLAATLYARLQELDATLFEPERGSPDHTGACAQVVANNGTWGPWL